MEQLQPIIVTKRSKMKLEHDGALYVFDQLSNDGLRKYWRCEFFGKNENCKGRLHSDLNNAVIKTVGAHKYSMNAANIECQRLLTGLKRRAFATLEVPLTIRSQTLEDTSTPVLAAFSSKNATKKIIKSVRDDENDLSAVPCNLEQL